MPRNQPIHASNKALNRIAHDQWLHLTLEGDDPTMLDHVQHIVQHRLAARDRDLIYAVYYDQLTYREVAERFDMRNKGSAWFAVNRATKRLRKLLGEHYA